MGAPTNRSNSKTTESIPRKLVREVKQANGEMNVAVAWRAGLSAETQGVHANCRSKRRSGNAFCRYDIIHNTQRESAPLFRLGLR